MRLRGTTLAFAVAIGCILVAAVGMNAAIAHFNIHLRKKAIYPEPVGGEERALRAIPIETAGWKRVGTDVLESAENEKVLGTQNYLTRFYAQKQPRAGSAPKALQLHVAYYTGMIDTVPHVPERCFTGGGMSLVGGPWVVPVRLDPSSMRPAENVPERYKDRVYTVRLSNEWSTAGGGRRVTLPAGVTPTEPIALRVSEYFSDVGKRRMFAGYFFVANGGWVSSADELRLLAFDLRNDYAFYMKVQVGSTDVGSKEELAELAGSLLDDLFGEIMTCVPDWMRVERGEWPPEAAGARTGG